MSKNNTNETSQANQSEHQNHQSKSESPPFQTIYEQNKNRIHYQMYKLGIHDPHNEFYTEGIYAMWNAYKKYQPIKGPMGTYFNYQIRYRLIDMLRRKTTELNNADNVIEQQKADLDNGNHHSAYKYPVVDTTGISIHDKTFWTFIRSRLSENQWKWVNGYIINGLSQKEIAEAEGVSPDAVKSWSREARKKLHKEEVALKRLLEGKKA